MSVLRINPITGSSVIMAEERSLRPHDFNENENKISNAHACHFCPGNESFTPPSAYAFPNENCWTVRSFANKYPILSNNGSFGCHEVLVDTPHHSEQLHELSEERLFHVLEAIRNRYCELKRNKNIRYIQVFKNSGQKAGASKEHSHWQIVASEFILKKQSDIAELSEKYFENNKKCILCNEIDTIPLELVVAENNSFILFTPFASCFTYEMWIAPLKHTVYFENLNDRELSELSVILLNALQSFKRSVGFDYNICIMNTPYGLASENMHFHIQIIPRTGNLAGFEFGTGCYINSVMPELAAEKLRLNFEKENLNEAE